MVTGRVVLLEGPSSTGTTSLATAFRDARAERGELWLLLGVDDVLSRLPAPWVDVGWPSGPGRFAAEGMRIERTRDRSVIHVGPTLRTLLRLHQVGVARAARAGIDVIADEVVLDDQTWADWETALDGLDARWVGLTCSAAELERRERRRGDRPVGLATAQLDAAPALAHHLRLDTTAVEPPDLLRSLEAFVDAWPAPTAGPTGPRPVEG